MTFLLEDPTPYLVVGVAVEAILAAILLRTGRGTILWAMLGVLVLTGLGVLVERLVVTEREEVEAAIDAAAAAVETNNPEAVKQHVAADAHEARTLVDWAFRQVAFSRVSIQHRKLNIRIIKTTSPPTAKATIEGMVYFKQPPQGYFHNAYPLDGTLELRKQGGRWMVSDYSMKNDPRGYTPSLKKS